MKYRVTCLTPTLIGDGQKLSPIDYMVWKDQVNVLDQRRIFKLLAKGPRLDGYLMQLKKSEKLDFASWGGFAQNFAGRRIPFEHSSSVPVYERARPENLFIPTFATSLNGPYIPGTAIKGALRTGAAADRWTEKTMADLAQRLSEESRFPRNPAQKIDDVGRVRRVAASDSASTTHAGMKVYLLRVSTLIPRGGEKFELGWKRQGGSVDSRRIDESTPFFAEMATPGVNFEGDWREKSISDRNKIFQSANRYAAGLLARHKEYAQWTGMSKLSAKLSDLEYQLSALGSRQDACVLSIGWGGGLLGKSAYLNTGDDSYRKIVRQSPLLGRSVQTGMPFPKTRRVIFEGNQPANLPGWVLLEVG